MTQYLTRQCSPATVACDLNYIDSTGGQMATATTTPLVEGTWQIDPVHSSIGFAVDYVGCTFRGAFRDVDATLTADSISGSARVASVDVKDENLAAHLQS